MKTGLRETVTFRYEGDAEKAQTVVYFGFYDDEQSSAADKWKAYRDASYIKFENIPRLPDALA